MAFLLELCNYIQKDLIDIYKSKAPELTRKQTGYLDAVRSAENLNGVEIYPLDAGTGKIKSVVVKYVQKGCSDVIQHTCEIDNCEPEVEVAPQYDTVNINHCISTKWFKFDEAEMRKLCDPDSQWRSRIINAHLDTFMVELNKVLISLQATNFGKFVPDIAPATYKDVTLLTAADAANYMGEAIILEDFLNLGVTEKPILIGAGNLSLYSKLLKIGCCNQLGEDLSQAGSYMFYRDTDVNTILGANHFIGLRPGVVQLATWNKYVGDYKKANDLFIKDTIVDPQTGLKLDIHIRYDDCAEVWAIKYFLNYELIFLPSDSFAYCDDLADVNYTLHYRGIHA